MCREKANYLGDPGQYDKKQLDVRSVGEGQTLCNRDPDCCHWVHYGPPRKRIGWGANICWLKREKSKVIQRGSRSYRIYHAGSLNCKP